ncbi:methylamine utilization protein MauE [bacterium BMS3Abin03]|nr:methylamine utilization protein MauE [bacterium BMS3Abin03]
MIKLLHNKYLLLILRILLAFVFIYAGTEKISNPSDFSQSIANYKLLPIFLVNIFAIILPWIELVSGLLLLFGVAVKENSAIISFLLMIFIIAIVISLIRGLNIDCGCFGTNTGTKIGFTKLIENFVLLIFSFLLMKYGSDFLTILTFKRND